MLIGGRALNGKVFFPHRRQAVIDGVSEELEPAEPRYGAPGTAAVTMLSR